MNFSTYREVKKRWYQMIWVIDVFKNIIINQKEIRQKKKLILMLLLFIYFWKRKKSSTNFVRWNISMYLKSQFAIFFAHGETLDDQFAHSICSLWCYCSHDQNSALPIFFLFAIWCHEVVKQDLCNALLSEHSGLN